MRLSDYLHEGLVIHDLEASDVGEVLEAIGLRFEDNGCLPSRNQAVEALRAREEVHTTVLGKGVAVPHATVPDLEKTVLLVARSLRPVPFGIQEGETANLFFVMLSPPGSEGEHLRLLARVCKLLRHPGFLDDVREAPNAQELLRRILSADALFP
jgi:mannitol/fructose-specific phosphotransferase system IIA component (Ntr-type)